MNESMTLATRLLEWYAREARDLPWRRTTDPYAIWVSEVMLQQTQVKTVVPYWERWLREFPTVTALAGAGEDRVLRFWEGLGYYRRARHLQAAARVIRDEHGGRVPAEAEALRRLPGVGRYTAGAVSSIAFNRTEPVLDGNVARVLTRLEALPGDPREGDLEARLWARARDLVEAAERTGRSRACSHLNQALMELGAVVCTPRNPACSRCPWAAFCEAHRRGEAEAFPQGRRRVVVTAREYVVLAAEYRGRVCLRRRPDGEVNGGFWELPCVEVTATGASPEAVAAELFGVIGAELEPLVVIRHSITRYRVRQSAYRLRLRERTERARRVGTWGGLRAWEGRAVTSAHRKILKALAGEGELRFRHPGRVIGKA